jgi:hypothetical protein
MPRVGGCVQSWHALVQPKSTQFAMTSSHLTRFWLKWMLLLQLQLLMASKTASPV